MHPCISIRVSVGPSVGPSVWNSFVKNAQKSFISPILSLPFNALGLLCLFNSIRTHHWPLDLVTKNFTRDEKLNIFLTKRQTDTDIAKDKRRNRYKNRSDWRTQTRTDCGTYLWVRLWRTLASLRQVRVAMSLILSNLGGFICCNASAW